MIDNLFSLLTKGKALEGITEVLKKVQEVFDLLEKDYLKDKNLRNAAIDALIEILNGCKEPEDAQ